MPTSGHTIHEISVERLKSVRDFAALPLDTTPLVAITGANGCGKSTIIHALACVYRPPVGSSRKNYKFPHFFLPSTDSMWDGSAFSVVHSFRDGAVEHSRVVSPYGKAQDRWTPRYENRPDRYVDYIGIDTCVPKIEAERATSFSRLVSTPHDDVIGIAVREAASKVLNRDYTAMSRSVSGVRRTYRGVRHAGINYTSLSMGAGEQRIFEIIERVFNAPKNSLVLIDELDLLLHEDALCRFILVLNERAAAKNLQIIFTTHRESVLSREDITVHHIFGADGRTLTMPSTHPDVWHRLTGKSVRLIEVFVEDDLARAVVQKVASDLGIRKHVDVKLAGAAANLFTLSSGLALRGENLENKHFFLDGDVFRTDQEKREQVNRVLTGHGLVVEETRQIAASSMGQMVLPEGFWPEKLLHSFLLSADEDPVSEIVQIARQIAVPLERHQFVDEILPRLGDSREVGIHKVVELAASAAGWLEYTSEVRHWFEGRIQALAL